MRCIALWFPDKQARMQSASLSIMHPPGALHGRKVVVMHHHISRKCLRGPRHNNSDLKENTSAAALRLATPARGRRRAHRGQLHDICHRARDMYLPAVPMASISLQACHCLPKIFREQGFVFNQSPPPPAAEGSQRPRSRSQHIPGLQPWATMFWCMPLRPSCATVTIGPHPDSVRRSRAHIQTWAARSALLSQIGGQRSELSTQNAVSAPRRRWHKPHACFHGAPPTLSRTQEQWCRYRTVRRPGPPARTLTCPPAAAPRSTRYA